MFTPRSSRLGRSEVNCPRGSRAATTQRLLQAYRSLRLLGCAKLAAGLRERGPAVRDSPIGETVHLRGVNARVMEAGTIRIAMPCTRSRSDGLGELATQPTSSLDGYLEEDVHRRAVPVLPERRLAGVRLAHRKRPQGAHTAPRAGTSRRVFMGRACVLLASRVSETAPNDLICV
jgi:hypothetical protein